ncbi:MAG: polyprenyl synthetase family protein, partial [Pseudomonadota bacterium]
KRLRPFFLLEAGRMFEAPEISLLRAAAALECVHTYSLVHDDLPLMEANDMRRGQPTVHRAFDDVTAVLAGDALLTLAFKILADEDTHSDPNLRLLLIERLTDASGARGMVGGQMIDQRAELESGDLHTITRMQRLKTGALIGYALEAGGILGGANEHERQALAGFANDLALAYQIEGELMTAEDNPDSLGAEGRSRRLNFVAVLGHDGARERVRLLAAQAKEHLAIFRDRAKILSGSVEHVLAKRR